MKAVLYMISSFVFVDHVLSMGGNEYLRRSGNTEDWEELSETQSVDD